MSDMIGVATRYRSRYTGREIDELLGAIQSKIDRDYIVNDWSGGADLVASAELARILHNRLEKFNDPQYVKELYLTIPDADIFTKQDRERLDRTIGFFLGSFPNAAERNLAISTTGFQGGEITFLLDDGVGQQELSYWDINTLSWKKSQWYRDMGSVDSAPTLAPDVVAIKVDRNNYSGGKYLIRATLGSASKMIEMLFVANGPNTWWTSYAEVGNLEGFSIKGITTTASEASILVTAPLGTILKFQRIAEI